MQIIPDVMPGALPQHSIAQWGARAGEGTMAKGFSAGAVKAWGFLTQVVVWQTWFRDFFAEILSGHIRLCPAPERCCSLSFVSLSRQAVSGRESKEQWQGQVGQVFSATGG